MNKILDKILLYLIYKRWRRLYKSLANGNITNMEYAIRRKYYESLMWEVRRNDLK